MSLANEQNFEEDVPLPGTEDETQNIWPEAGIDEFQEIPGEWNEEDVQEYDEEEEEEQGWEKALIPAYDDEPLLEVILPPPTEYEGEGQPFDYQYYNNYYNAVPEDGNYAPFYGEGDNTQYDPNYTEQNFAYVMGYDQGYQDLPLRGGHCAVKHDEEMGEDKVPIDFEQLLLDSMTIPEQEARDALDRAALITDNKDTLPSFLGEEEINKEGYEPAEFYVSNQTPVFYRCPSIESFFQQDSIVRVNLYLEPGQKMICKNVRLDTTIYELKEAVSRYARIHPDMLDLRLKHSLLTNTKTLADLGVKPYSKVRFTVEINKRMDHHTLAHLPVGDGEANQLVLKIPDLNDRILPYRADTVHYVNVPVDVNVDGSEEEGSETEAEEVPTNQITIIIVHPTEKKPMLGGFKNKITSIVYHDASTNTPGEGEIEEETGAEKYEKVFGDEMCGTGVNAVPRRLRKKKRIHRPPSPEPLRRLFRNICV